MACLENEGCRLEPGLRLACPRAGISAALRSVTVRYRSGARTVEACGPLGGAAEPAGPCCARLEVPLDALSAVLEVGLPAAEQHATLGCRLRSRASGPLWIAAVEIELEVRPVGEGEADSLPLVWYRNGWQSWSYAGVVDGSSPAMPCPRAGFVYGMKEDPLVPRDRAVFFSDMVAAVKIGDHAFLCGAWRQERFQRVEVVPGRGLFRLRLVTDMEDAALAPGGVCLGGGWELEGAATATFLLRAWAQRLAASAGIRRRAAVVGWCSWYERGPRITAAFIRQAVEALARPELAAARWAVVDDGYEAAVGDWLTPRRGFGGTVTEAAREIAQAGLAPGVWLAPFVAQGRSALFKRHPDWFLQGPRGPVRAGWNPNWLDSFFALDLTHPEVEAWLARIFKELRDAGYRLFKLDFLYGAALPGRRFDRERGRFAALRGGLQAVRGAVGDEAVLLGCGCPLAPAVGVVDIMRVSPDVAYSWKSPPVSQLMTGDEEIEGLYGAVRNTLARGPFARALWLMDPDCLLLRTRRGPATAGERNLHARLASLSGDVLLIGDDVTRWGKAEAAQFAALAAEAGDWFHGLDGADVALPAWALAGKGERVLLAAFNLGERTEMQSLSCPKLEQFCGVAGVRTLEGSAGAVSAERVSISNVERHGVTVLELELEQREPAPRLSTLRGIGREEGSR